MEGPARFIFLFISVLFDFRLLFWGIEGWQSNLYLFIPVSALSFNYIYFFYPSHVPVMISAWRGRTTAPFLCARRLSGRTTSPRSPTEWTEWRTGCPSSGRKEWYVLIKWIQLIGSCSAVTLKSERGEVWAANSSCYGASCHYPFNHIVCSDDVVGRMTTRQIRLCFLFY